MTTTYKFNDRNFNKGNKASQNIRLVLLVLALIVIAGTLDLTILEVVSESAKFM